MSHRLFSLLEGFPCRVARGDDVDIFSVTADSRRVAEASAFVAVRGHAADGHAYLGAAVSQGATALVVDSDGEASALQLDGPTVIVVEDPREALGMLCRRQAGAPDQQLQVVAITGTNGKTTTSHLVRDLLTAIGRSCGLIGTILYDDLASSVAAPLTTPGPEELMRIFGAVRENDGVAISMEASSHALDQRRLAGIEVDVAAYTNLTHEHLDYHDSLDQYLQAKRLLLDHLDQSDRSKPVGRAVVNVDDPILGAQEWPAATVTVGSAEGCTVRAIEVKCTAESIELEVEVEVEGRRCKLQSRLLGRYNAANLLVVVGIAHALGIDLDDIRDAFKSLCPVPGRLERVELAGGPLGLVDYAHTPDGMRSALAAVRELVDGRLVVVFGCGGDRDRSKRPMMARAAIEGADEAILTLDNPRTEDPEQIFADAMAGFGDDSSRAHRIDDRGLAIAEAIDRATSEGAVLVCGKGHEDYQIIGEQKFAWDDRAALRDAWSRRGGAA